MAHEFGFGQIPFAISARLAEFETTLGTDVKAGSGENAAAPWDNATSRIQTAIIVRLEAAARPLARRRCDSESQPACHVESAAGERAVLINIYELERLGIVRSGINFQQVGRP
jgi:hypothetical protein